jgi:OmpA-OmpF porin, OOP family
MRIISAITLTAIALFTVGCATKSYVRNEVTPVINHVNDLDDRIGQNSRELKAVDGRLTEALNSVNTDAETTTLSVVAAGNRAGAAQSATSDTAARLRALETTLTNLDHYRSLTEKSVPFRFGDNALTAESQKSLDELAKDIPNTPNYLITVEGATDAVGPRDYNYALSQQRASVVVRYLASKYNIPPYRLRSVGVGQDKPTAPNDTARGRAQNRRADVVLLSTSSVSRSQESNSEDETTAASH